MIDQPNLGLEQQPIRIDEAIAELERELKMRENVFPRWVANGRLSQRAASYRIDCLKAAIGFLKDHLQDL